MVGINSTSIRPFSSQSYELPAHSEGFSGHQIPFQVPSLVLAKDDTLKKACIGTISQIQKNGYNYISLQFGDNQAI